MLCANGLAKITDFSFATFASRLDMDPWTGRQPPGGQLVSVIEGSTLAYTSPEQRSMIAKLKERPSRHQRKILKEDWPLTPATSDLYQAALTCLEMFARSQPWLGRNSQDCAPAKLVESCARRKRAVWLVKLPASAAERWVVFGLGLAQFSGRLESNGIDGAALLRFPRLKLTDQNQLLKSRQVFA